jgi:hypothetical protein
MDARSRRRFVGACQRREAANHARDGRLIMRRGID